MAPEATAKRRRSKRGNAKQSVATPEAMVCKVEELIRQPIAALSVLKLVAIGD
jgi:hypothetical protein